VPSSLALGREE